ncbi:MAG: hydrogenase nickel incorporation protein HypB [Sedimentisphaerales bacterium]|jgi:hydrogenase nickel incorporation protein HypB|nr:hydrogenase nickel incorporation protein HypB [Sedimentisphaerales bacterium]HNY77716.1 hydrogenase nickel incorporation protein HypB [Sedimentisphaerales bacterium]HOC63460.1 hydrogenase nickel incorporation protein HypB [Sedimentisphaerales bacterium]HOH63891.1 hydrogenase nickel incorporation protein HypB [Sedimentisphaerales bacterium]HPY51525.1 hydrogenase nickel incorporation protein HypB [Sedimentisphaerales bacterium]
MEKVNVGTRILGANEQYAMKNIELLAQRKQLCLNMISSPGSGKTTILVRTISDLKGQLRIGVIEGDLQTDIDAQRIRATQAPAIQINTEGACHLSARQVYEALGRLPLDALDAIVIENVGNLVCPAAFELGETGKIVVLSVAEGDDKPVKYPGIFAKSKALLVNKIDLLRGALVEFDLDRVKADARRLNKSIEIFPVCAKSGEGMQNWYDWLGAQVRQSRL